MKPLEGKELLQRLQSKINTDGIEAARLDALLRIHTVGRDIQKKIIKMFRTWKILTFRCIQCKRETEHVFSPFSLRYDKQQTQCNDCLRKINKVIEEQKLDEKMKALEVFKQKHDAWLDIKMNACNVPSAFIDAKEADVKLYKAGLLKSSQSYFITGGVGVGKTHLAVALIRKYISYIKPYYDDHQKEYMLNIKQSDLPIFIEVPELLLRIRDSYKEKSTMSEKEIVDYYTMTPFLVLDDLGIEKASEFSTLMLYLIINRRCSNELTTIITSNLTLDEINNRLSSRISSRIKGMCKIIGMTGHDRRFEDA